MLRVTLKGLLQHKLRLALTTLAVVTGVAFVVGALVLTDSVRAQFDTLFAEINQGIDLTVRAEERFDEGPFGARAPVPDDLVPQIEAVDGVANVVPNAGGLPALLIDADGDPVAAMGGPPLGVSVSPSDELSQVTFEEGSAKPVAGDEIAIDKDLADRSGFGVGDTVQVQTPRSPDPERPDGYRITGVFTFGESNSLAGATIIAFTFPEAQRLFNLEGQASDIAIGLEDGADPVAVQAAIEPLLPDGVEVVDNETVVGESQQSAGQIVDIFGNVLLGFAGVTLFVSAFLIFNTFLIIVGQRVRELALLRAIGASQRQVAFSVLGEALVVGLVASIIGFAGGIVVAVALNTILNAIGAGTSETTIVLKPWALVAAFGVGVGATVLSALLPAWTATHVPPVAGLRAGYRLRLGTLRSLGIIGGLVVAIGAVAIGVALTQDLETLPLLVCYIVGALSVFIGAALASTAVAGPVSEIVGAPFSRGFGRPGRLAQENAAREPTRTAFTAAALMIGISLVSTTLVVGTSIRETFVDVLGKGITADWYVSGGPQAFYGFSNQVAEQMAEAPELTSVTGGRFGAMQVDDSVKDVFAVDLGVADELFELDVQQGTLEGAERGLLIHEDPARDLGVGPGDTVTVTFQQTGQVELPVVAVYADASVLGNWIIDLQTHSENFADQTDFFVAAKTAEGSTAEQARAAIERITESYPQIEVQDRDEYEAAQLSQLNLILGVIVVFLLLAVAIAIIGITNTLALSVVERTRELGLLRAVGMERRQVTRMVVVEAVIVAIFGALLGVVIGLAFGWVLGTALPDEVVARITVPYVWLVFLVLLSAGLGVVAALFPAWRASRLNVLEAIAHE
ncbi:MAG: FtsX-like permease family protein [Acidimicrobiales bacterium]|jgi:putative ABC transport system permease protein|nr:FtsX-like permease family protein [Acidimicrobiales bacterium]